MAIIKLINYSTPTNKEPFAEWLDDLDLSEQAIILSRLERVTLGNFGNCKPIKDGEGIYGNLS